MIRYTQSIAQAALQEKFKPELNMEAESVKITDTKSRIDVIPPAFKRGITSMRELVKK